MDFTRRNAQANTIHQTQQAVEYDAGLRSYMLMVFNYMSLALAASGATAFMVSRSPTLINAIFGTPLHWVVALAPLGFIMFMGFRIQKMSLSAAQIAFWTFSVLMGLSLTSIFLVYTGASIAKVFFITASLFGAMSIYGYSTGKDLTSWGSLLFMGLLGIIIASIINLFLASPAMDFAISIIGVLIFTGLTAYDTQKIKLTYYQTGGTSEMAKKFAIMGALNLYLDFINLLIMLLRLFGNRR